MLSKEHRRTYVTVKEIELVEDYLKNKTNKFKCWRLETTQGRSGWAGIRKFKNMNKDEMLAILLQQKQIAN